MLLKYVEGEIILSNFDNTHKSENPSWKKIRDVKDFQNFRSLFNYVYLYLGTFLWFMCDIKVAQNDLPFNIF